LADDDFLAVHKLLNALEDSDRGNSALDLRISQCLDADSDVHVSTADAALTAELAPETVDLILGEVVAPYTQSLDARIPSENIVFSMYSARRRQWVSVHRDEDGKEYVSWAATEPLARRAAALRGLKGIFAGNREGAVLDLVKAGDGSRVGPPAPGVPAEDDLEPAADRPAWKVSF
jgi:hypothetical protein